MKISLLILLMLLFPPILKADSLNDLFGKGEQSEDFDIFIEIASATAKINSKLITHTIILKNNGATPRAININCYLYKNRTNTNPINSYYESINVGAYENFVFERSINASNEGLHTLSCIADEENSFLEKDRTNNYSSLVETIVYSTTSDFDADQISDYWEIEHGLNPEDKTDAMLDSDGDGVSNKIEFNWGTLPNNKDSYISPQILYSKIHTISDNYFIVDIASTIIGSNFDEMNKRFSVSFGFSKDKLDRKSDIIYDSFFDNKDVYHVLIKVLVNESQLYLYRPSFIFDKNITIEGEIKKYFHQSTCSYSEWGVGHAFDAQINKLWFNEEIRIAISNDSIYTSIDGVSWELSYKKNNALFIDIFWDGAQFLVLNNIDKNIYASVDGKVWQVYDTNLSFNPIAISWNGKEYIVVGNNGGIAYSRNSQDWVDVDSKTNNHLTDVTWYGDEKIFLVSGGNGTVLKSQDGKEWTPVLFLNSNAILQLESNGKSIVATDHVFGIYFYQNGKWNDTGSRASGYRIAWDNYHYVIPGTQYTLISDDGQLWRRVTAIQSDPYGVHFDGEYMYVAGRSGILYQNRCDVAANDRDGDGVPNDQDSFPDDKNESKDNDKDGFGDNADTDDDNDGMLDTWEQQYSFDQLNSADAGTDADNDGFTNKQEHDANAHPRDAKSYPVKAKVSTVIPETANVGEKITVIVTGTDLPDTLDMQLADCAGIQKLAGATATEVKFTCTFSSAGTKSGTIKDKAGSNYTLKTFSLNVSEVLPDLRPVNLQIPASVKAGASINVSVDIENIGGTATPASSLGVWLSEDDVLSGNEALPPVPIPAVLTSTSANVSFDVYIPEHITSNYRLFVKADAAQVVTESNEDNNQITANLVMEESCIAYNEPDSQFTAIPIGLNTSIQRSICPAGDVDWLTFTLPSPSSLRLETSGASGHDTFMTLYDWKFDSNTAKSDDDSGEGYYSKLLFDCTAPLPAGKYIVKINQYADNARIPDYSLHLQDVKACVTDSDGDGFLDDNDAFPNDPKEWLDTDGDGSGNNADSDDDNDGMPDTWEEQHGFDSLNKTDADQDADNDGFTNKQEHDAGTDPKDAKSYPITAKVYSVEPLVADVNENTVFTVKGIKLPNTLAFWIGYCEGLTKLPNATETQVQFSCTPSRAEKLQGLVKDKSGGSLLMEFFVEASVLDKDQDGIKDTLDNCPEIKNTDQKDLDRDKIGDVCDTDRDGDSVSNDQDAFPDDKAESKDNDKDGIGNNADPDDDNDGMPDTWEEQHGLDPLNSTDATQDADKDSFTNKQEYDAGTDPKNAKSYPVTATISSVTPNTAIVGKRLELVITGKNLTGSIDVTLSGCDDMQIRTDGVYPQLSPKSALKNAVAPPTAPPPPPGTLPPLPGVGDLVNQFTASCMPTAAGLKTGVIRDKAGSDYILKQFEVTVANVDTTPEPFPFTHQTGVALSALISSNEITVSGINTATAISVTGGKYSINGGAYVSTAGTVSNGDKVKVQHTSSASYATKTETVVTIGGIAETFISTTKVNNAPTANAGIDQTVDSGANVTLTGSGADVDGDAIAHNWVQTAGTPTVSLMGAATSSPSFTAPQVSQDTKFTFTLTVSDGKGGTMSDTVDVTVKAAVDTKPDLFTFTDQIGVAFSSIMTSNEITVSGINTATAIAVTGGKYSINGGAYVSTAGTVSNGDKVKVQHMSSASYATKTETVVTIGGIAETFISTTKVNTPPTAQGSDETLNEDTPKTITLIATDSEDDKLTYTIVTQPKNGQAPLIGNTVTYKPNTNFNGKDSFTFKANDGNTDSAVATVNLQINAVNDAPTANAGIDQTVDSGANVTLTGSGADVDGDAIAHNWVQTAGTPTVSLIGATTSSPSFTAPQVSQDTKFTFTLTVSDGKGGTMSDSVDVTVKAAVDTKPDLFTFTDQIGVAFSSIMTSNEITVSGINTVTAIAVTGGKYSINGGGYVSTAGTVSNGDKVKVQHTSSASYATKTETVVTIGGIAETFISTTKVNTPPTAKDQVLSVTDGKALAFTLEGSDTDGDTLTYKITQSATNGTLLGSGNQFTYTPQAKWSGTEVITFTVSDGNAVSAPATIRITVTAVDTTPDAIVFTPKTDVDLSSLMESNAVKISGINTNVPISITGGEYSIDGAAYTSASATVSTGATLKVRHTSAASHASKTETVLTVGDVSATFTSLTRAEQTKADLVVSVTNQPNVTPDEFTSHLIRITNQGNATAEDVIVKVMSPADANGDGKLLTEFVARNASQGTLDCPLSHTDSNSKDCLVSPPTKLDTFMVGTIPAGQTATVEVINRYSGYTAGNMLNVSANATTSTAETVTTNNTSAQAFTLQAKRLVQGCDYRNMANVSPYPQTESRIANHFHALTFASKDTNPITLFGYSDTGEQAILNGDGFQWSGILQNGTYPSNIWAVAKADTGTHHVGVSLLGGLFWSDDRITWTPVTAFQGNALNDIAYAKGRYVAVGAQGTILTSVDGINWQQATSGTTAKLAYVDTGNNEFVVGGQGIILSSTDGLVWTTRATNTGQDASALEHGAVWNGSQYLLFDSAGNSHLMAANLSSLTTTAAIKPTVDGVTEVATARTWSAIYWQDNQYIALTTQGLLTSSDGRAWTTQQAIAYPYTYQRLADKAVIAGAHGSIWAAACAPVSVTPPPTLNYFVEQKDVSPATLLESNTLTVSGLAGATTLTITGGEYRKNGAAYTKAKGTVQNGDTLQVRHTTSSKSTTAVTTTLKLGKVAIAFKSTTQVIDSVPDAFSFNSQTDVPSLTWMESNVVTVSGVNAPIAISISGGEYRINNGSYTKAKGTVRNGDTLQVRHASSTKSKTTITTTLKLGTQSFTFKSTTLVIDSVPDALSFNALTDVARNAWQESASVTVSGINAPLAISISGGEYSINKGTYTKAKGMVKAGDTLQVRHLSAKSAKKSVTTTLTLGKSKVVFKSTTQ